MLSAFGENGLVTNLAAMLTEHGVTVTAAALALSVRGGAGIIGRLCTGFLIDRFPAQRIQTVILLISAAGTFILAFSGTSVHGAGWAQLCSALDSEAKRTSRLICWRATSGENTSRCCTVLPGPPTPSGARRALWWLDTSMTAQAPISRAAS